MPNVSSLLVVGASGRFIANSAATGGYCVEVIDLFADLDTQQICDASWNSARSPRSGPAVLRCHALNEIPAMIAAADPPATAGVILAGGMEHQVHLFNKNRSYCRFGHTGHADRTDQQNRVKWFACPQKSFKRLLDLSEYVDFACQHQINFPESVTDDHRIFQIRSGPQRQHWLLKNLRSAGGMGVQWLSLITDRTRRPLAPGQLIQRFVPGESLGGCYVAAKQSNGKIKTNLLGITQALGLPAAQPPTHDRLRRDFRYTGSIGPLHVPAEVASEILRIGQLAADHFDLAGVFGIDFIVGGNTAQDVWMIEINPRITASAEVIERTIQTRVPKFSIAKLHIDAFGVGQRSMPMEIADAGAPTTLSTNTICGKQVVYWPPDRPVLTVTPAFHRQIERLTQDAESTSVTDIPVAGSTIAPGSPVVSVHVIDDNPTAVRKRVANQIEKLLHSMGAM